MNSPELSTKPAETVTVTITDLARGGAGVARLENGQVIFVPFTMPGDQAEVTLTEVNKRYAQAALVRLIQPSANRERPRCSIFGKCGGCEWQHLPYDLQWKTKSGGVKHALNRVNIQIPEDWKEFPAPSPFGYRNRIQLRGQNNEMGFFARQSHQLITTSECPVARKEINEAWAETLTEGSKLSRSYKVEIEVLESGKIQRTWNAPHGASGFRQINDEQNLNLQNWIADSLTPGRELFDLFGGAGNLSLGLCSKMTKVHCVDTSAPAEKPAGLPQNIVFHRSSTLSWLIRKHRDEKGVAHAVRSAILDPPRSGLAEHFKDVASTLESLGVNEVVAVGCDVDSWVRDVSKFIRRGWRLEKGAVLDFFPQTPHIESVGLLRV